MCIAVVPSALRCRPQLSGGSDLDRQAPPFRGGCHRRPGAKEKYSGTKEPFTYGFTKERRQSTGPRGKQESTSVLAHKGQKEQARNEFPFRFRYVYLTLPLGARGYCGWQGLEWKGVEFNCPTGELDSHEERNGVRVSHSVAVGQGRFRNNGY